MAVVWAAEADMVSMPVPVIDQSSPPVMATVVEALVLPMAMTSAAVPSVAILIVSVPELLTPPISMVFVEAESEMLTVLVTAAVKRLAVVEEEPATGVSRVTTTAVSVVVITR